MPTIEVYPEGSRVVVEGNGKGTVKYFLAEHHKTPRYRIERDEGGEVEITYDKVTLISKPGDVGAVPTVGDQIRRAREELADTGVVRAPSQFRVGTKVCLCQHPEYSHHDHFKGVIASNSGNTIRPWAVRPLDPRAFSDLGFIWCNDRQMTQIDIDEICPYSPTERKIDSGVISADKINPRFVADVADRLADGRYSIKPDMSSYLKKGDDVTVEGYGLGKVAEVDMRMKKITRPYAIRLVNGDLRWFKASEVTKIKLGKLDAPATQANLREVADAVANLTRSHSSLSAQIADLRRAVDKIVEELSGE